MELYYTLRGEIVMKLKKIAGAFLSTTIMCFTCGSLTTAMNTSMAFTASAVEITNLWLKYKITDGEICITGHIDGLPSGIVIPAEIGGVLVTSIGDSAFE